MNTESPSFLIVNTNTCEIIGSYVANTETQALDLMAVSRGHKNYLEFPNKNGIEVTRNADVIRCGHCDHGTYNLFTRPKGTKYIVHTLDPLSNTYEMFVRVEALDSFIIQLNGRPNYESPHPCYCYGDAREALDVFNNAHPHGADPLANPTGAAKMPQLFNTY